jgi:riboflavin biosynthesis pyrimidine reductase
MELDLVDELRLVIAPALAGGGRRLFDGDNEVRRLELLRSVSTPSGAVLADYRMADPADG